MTPYPLPAVNPLRAVLAAALAAGLVFGLSACGKKGAPKPPAGQESEYNYPQAYPAPDTVVPDTSDEPASGTNPFSIFVDSDRRTKTTTY